MSSNAVVVRIDYRLSAQQPYPIAVHDVLAGYDWIKKHLGGVASTSDGVSNPIMQRKLGVCGELLGGSLASMLALTECHADKQSISVAALGNPITDWTAFFPEAQDINPANTTPAKVDGSAAKRTNPFLRISSIHESSTTEDLLALRDKMFRKPAHFFDPFASPALYFRTPSFDLPTEIPASIARYLTPSSSSSERESPQPLVRKRRSHRKYPPLSSGLRLPKMRIELGNDGVLKEQGLELVELMQRSVDMWEDDERSSTMNQKETERIQPIMRKGSGLWGEWEMNQIGLWFAEAFC